MLAPGPRAPWERPAVPRPPWPVPLSLPGDLSGFEGYSSVRRWPAVPHTCPFVVTNQALSRRSPGLPALQTTCGGTWSRGWGGVHVPEGSHEHRATSEFRVSSMGDAGPESPYRV